MITMITTIDITSSMHIGRALERQTGPSWFGECR